MNSELLHQVADAIEANPARYDQKRWYHRTSCGTAYCVAGWVIALGAPQALTATGHIRVHPRFGDVEGVDWVEDYVDTSNALLGITAEEAGELYWGGSAPRLGHTVPEALHKMAEMGRIDPDVWGRPE